MGQPETPTPLARDLSARRGPPKTRRSARRAPRLARTPRARPESHRTSSIEGLHGCSWQVLCWGWGSLRDALGARRKRLYRPLKIPAGPGVQKLCDPPHDLLRRILLKEVAGVLDLEGGRLGVARLPP